MYTCAKHCHKRSSSDKAIAKIRRCSFFCLTVYVRYCVLVKATSNFEFSFFLAYYYSTIMVNKGDH